uniref:hypothetical protein n=1 Tax=Salmonella sp. s51228 TaxID=3159652 RepID=UPI00397FDB49
VITVESMTELLTDEEAVQSLYGLLQDSPEPIANVLTSPQFMESVNIFSQGFASCQLGPLMNEFGPDAVQAANTADILALSRALEATLNETPATEDNDLIDPNDELD